MGEDKLVWPLKNGDLDEVKNIINEGANVNSKLPGGRMALHIAADFGQKEVMKYLISKGADVNAFDEHKMTALHCACLENHIDCVRLLLEEGADKSVKLPEGVSPAEAAENPNIKALLQ